MNNLNRDNKSLWTYLYKCCIIIFLLLHTPLLMAINCQPRLLNAVYPAASEEQQCLLIDKQGMIWMGTDGGVKSYDGYRFKTYRSDATTPNILPSNTVLSLTEGKDDVLWIGTRNGLVSMDKKTGKFTTHNLPGIDNRIIYALFTSHDGKIWIGTDGGVTCYLPEKKTFLAYNSKNTTVVEANDKRHVLKEKIRAKSFTEDKHGNIYIGTWSKSLYRLDAKKSILYQYDIPKAGDSGNTYLVKLDHAGRLWICTWDNGIKCMTQPLNQQNPGFIDLYQGDKDFAIHYNIVEDTISHTIWVCSRNGYGILDSDNIKAGFTYYKSIDNHPAFNVVDVDTDGKGNVWLLTRNYGLYHVYTRPALFQMLPVIPQDVKANRISSIFTIDGQHFWLTFAPAGIALYDATTQQTSINNSIPAFAGLPYDLLNTHYSAIIDNGKGALWFANNGYGITCLQDGKIDIINETINPIVNDRFVNVLYRSQKGVIFAGEKQHLNYMLPSGKSYTCLQGVDVRGITEDHLGNIWIATENQGILRIKGDFTHPKSLNIKYYNASQGNFLVNDATNSLEDSKHRLWVISNSGGLFRYDEEKDAFMSVNNEYHWDINRIFSIIEDREGNLWLTTDNALVCLQIDENGKAQYTTYTQEDGLGDLMFMPNSCFRRGNDLYFGAGRNLIHFNSATLNVHQKEKQLSNIVITDLLVDDKRYSELDSILQKKLCDVTPLYMRQLTLPACINKFAVEFALLTYTNTDQCKYAYYLEGYDKEWHYVDASIRQASFENLPSGSYKLHVKAADSYGHWNEMAYTIHIKVLPPWYASWWAYLIYIALLIVGIRIAIIWYRERLRTKNRLQMAVVFTNITHELLTPLTVISAAADSIKRIAPAADSQTAIIHDNINRLTRMLRQILEVRKSQAGKLQLKVSEGMLGNFCDETCRSLMPMFTSKQLSFEQNISCMDELAWFDTDKVEKMLYNLLNNAVKYTTLGGKVSLSVSIADEKATLVVSDTGVGISKDKMKHLYNRFLDGDYRQMNTIGTGIGLSLVNDLVRLHHGKIKCDSEVGKGTTFTITLPINKESYTEEEMLKTEKSLSATDSIIMPNASKSEEAMASSQDNTSIQEGVIAENHAEASTTMPSDSSENKEYTILLVEDNQELLLMMSSLLSSHYHVLTATNGEKAQKLIQKSSLDVVVTDVMMPVMDGIELTKWIKGNEDYSQLPVVMLTAKTQDEDRNEAYRVGADAYITKPFNLTDLQLRIDNIIANRERIRQKFQAQTDFNVEDQHYSSPDEIFIQSVMDKVKGHLMDSEYGREQLAADLCISSSTLYNKLRALTGQNVTGFISSIRMKEACKILKQNPHIRVNELSYQVGFSTPRYFSQCFKKEFGMTVKEYLEKK